MTASGTQALITGAATDFGAAALVVLGATLTIAVGVFVFSWGWRKLRGAA